MPEHDETTHTLSVLEITDLGQPVTPSDVATKKDVPSDPVQCPYTLAHVPIGVGHNPIPCLTCHLEVRPRHQQLQCWPCRRWQHRVCRQAKLGNRSGVNLLGMSIESTEQINKIYIWQCTHSGLFQLPAS